MFISLISKLGKWLLIEFIENDFDNAAWPRFDIQFWPHPDVF